LVGNYEGKEPQGSTRLRWKDDIKIDFEETGMEVWTSIDSCESGNGPPGSIKFWQFLSGTQTYGIS
jgi:hypothetical protein